MKKGSTINNDANQVQVYRVSKGWKIFFAILFPPMLVLFGWIMVMPFLEGRYNQIGYIVLCLLLGGGAILFFLYAFLSVFKSRIEVYPDRIRDVCLFKTNELLIDEISGFKILSTQNAPTLLLLPKDPKKKKIKTVLMIEHRADFLEWLNRNLINLDTKEFQEGMDQVLHDNQLGDTEEQRLLALKRAKRWANILNVLGFIAILWAIFKPQPYSYVIWALILLPLISLGFVHYFKGALKFDSKKQSPFPNIAGAFLMPCLGLTLRSFIDFNILSWDKFWFPYALVSLCLYLATIMVAKDIKQQIGTAILLVIFCALYGYASVISLNGILDKSTPSIYKAMVIQKRISKGKHTSYYLKLSPWGPRNIEKEVDVRRSIYDKSIVSG